MSDTEMLSAIPRLRSMDEVRAAATAQNLGDLFDAHEIFCSGYGWIPEAWRLLSLQISLYMKKYFRDFIGHEGSYALRDGASFESYLKQLATDELSFLTNDLVTEFFRRTGVLEREEQILRDGDIIDLFSVQDILLSSARKLVRKHFSNLSNTDIYLMLDDISNDLYNRSMNPRLCAASDGTWDPCSSSHCAILLLLDISVPPDDSLHLLQLVRQSTLYYNRFLSPLVHVEESVSTPRLLERAFSRAGVLLRASRRSRESVTEHERAKKTGNEDTIRKDEEARQSKRNTKRSSYSDNRSFVTALTHGTNISGRKSYATAQTRPSMVPSSFTDKRSTVQTFLSCPADDRIDESVTSSSWSNLLRERDIVSDPNLEDWSDGRGQHAEYQPGERHLIPLHFEKRLGTGGTAVVDSVRCKRVCLVKKVIICNKRTRLNKDDAIQEIQQLYKAQHTPIVRLVGTYVIGDELAILTYPCTEWNLEDFLSSAPIYPHIDKIQRSCALRRFFTCLVRLLDFIHSFPIKHMDIKPKNLLVRVVRHSLSITADDLKIYLTDFGSSRLYDSIDDTETDHWTPFTRMYAAKEVILQETRGLSADIFSMGCVFAEMLAVTLEGMATKPATANECTYGHGLLQARSGSDAKIRPYHSKLASVCAWLGDLPILESHTDLRSICIWTFRMLNNDPASRPTAREMANDSSIPWSCIDCAMRPGPEKFQAAPLVANRYFAPGSAQYM